MRLLGHLLAEGVPLDLTFLYDNMPRETDLPPARTITIRSGGDPFHIPPPPSRQPPAPPTDRTARPHAFNPPQPLAPTATAQLLEQMTTTHLAHAQAQETFLRLAQNNTRAIGEAISFQMSLRSTTGTAVLEAPASTETQSSVLSPQSFPPPARNRAACLEFAIGSIAKVLGPEFAHVDAYPTRVRLPHEPLMLVDRITAIEGEPNALALTGEASGRVITEHDVLPGVWYLDANRIPTCIAVEAGQADLFLSGYLGIDTITKGHAVYRLLDAVVTFHGPLATPGQTIIYDIAIEKFFRQGDTHLFRFHFDATVNGQPFLTMKNGCAGFFTAAELAAGQGIVQTSIDKRPLPGKRPADWQRPRPHVRRIV